MIRSALKFLLQLHVLIDIHWFQVVATDNGDNPHSATLNVHVSLADDRPPVITHDISSSTVSIQEKTLQNTLLGTFQAGGNVKYYLIGKLAYFFSKNFTLNKVLNRN